MAHVFISYKHEDNEFAALLKLQLQDAGFEAWLDEDRLRAGEDWREGIDKAIRDALALIVVMTPEAKDSEYVTYEWACAWGAGVPVIPLLLKPTQLHPRLEALQYLDFTNRKSRNWDKLIERLDEIDQKTFTSTVRIPRDAPPSIKRAVEALDSADPGERHAAVESLAQTNHVAAHKAFVEAILHPVRGVRRSVALTLGILIQESWSHELGTLRKGDFKRFFEGIPATEILLRALQDNDVFIRSCAIDALGKLGDVAAIPNLLEVLHDEDRGVRESSVKALGILGDATVVSALKDTLCDQEAGVRWRAIEALGAIGNEHVVSVLIDVFHHEDTHMHHLAAEALTHIGTSEALAAVEQWKRKQKQNNRNLPYVDDDD